MTKKKAEDFDLGALDSVAACSEGAELQLLHPATFESLPIFIMLLGADSPEYRAAQHKGQSQAIRKAQSKGRTIDFDDIEERGIEVLAACTRAWRTGDAPAIKLHGEELICNKANATKLYKAMPWIKEQVDKFVSDRGNFIKG